MSLADTTKAGRKTLIKKLEDAGAKVHVREEVPVDAEVFETTPCATVERAIELFLAKCSGKSDVYSPVIEGAGDSEFTAMGFIA